MQAFLGELVFHPSPQTPAQPFVGRDKKQAPLKTPVWEANHREAKFGVGIIIITRIIMFVRCTGTS